MQKIISLLTICFLFSCQCDLKKFRTKDKSISFNDYFNDIKNNNLTNELKGFNFMSLRGINYQLTFPDGMIVVFDHNNCKIKITNCLNINPSTRVTGNEIRNNTIKTLERILQFNITILETNESQFEILVEKKIFKENTLPFYEPKRKSVTNYVVLVYSYKDVIQDSINDVVFKYYKPVRIDKNWYYYLD